MRLKRLELSGFKSFARKTVFDFDAPITAVVGPNGSGKSNLAEAFQWVLGEQSFKSLRGRRGEDLIFNGAAGGGSSSQAAVAITLDNKDRALAVDFDEVTVSRTVWRDGNNEYAINGTAVRLKDVLSTIAQLSLGPSGHQIISQGEADRILAASPALRRELIEDALGLKLVHWKIAEAERKLARTEANIVQTKTLQKEIEPHLKFLKKQAEKLDRAEASRQELAGLYKEYLARERQFIAFRRREIEAARVSPLEELAGVREKSSGLKEKFKHIKPDDGATSRLTHLAEEIGSIRREIADIVREEGRLEGMIEIKSLPELSEPRLIPAAKTESFCQELMKKIDSALSLDNWSMAQRIIAEIKQMVERFASEESLNRLAGKNTEEISRLRERKTDLTEKRLRLEAEELKMLTEKESLEKTLSAAAEAESGAEKEILLLSMQEAKLSAELSSHGVALENLASLEDELKREVAEAIVLVAREAAAFMEGDPISNDIHSEPREKQIERRRAIEKIKLKLEDFGAEDIDVRRELKDVDDRFGFLSKELADLAQARESLELVMHELGAKLSRQFTEGLTKINQVFGEMFQLMFGGGGASLVLRRPEKIRRKRSLADDFMGDEETASDGDQIEEEGVEISVNLPRKKIRSLAMLSGGERALTSIALIFAISRVNPPPFLVLDETDAALDEANSRRYGDMIETLSQQSQLILITHNRETMTRAGVLYGVTIGNDGVSRLLSVKLDEAALWAK